MTTKADRRAAEQDVIFGMVRYLAKHGEGKFMRAETIHRYMPFGAHTVRQKYSDTDVKNALARLLRQGRVIRQVRSKSGWYQWAVYTLPDEGPGEK